MQLKNEADLMRAIQLKASERGARLFRNNVGLFLTADGRKVATGLCKGSSDLIGWTEDGRFLAVEVKWGKGRPSPEQLAFRDSVNNAGGAACIVWNVEDFEAFLND